MCQYSYIAGLGLTRFQTLKAFLTKKGFSSRKLKLESISYEKVFDDQFQFVLRLSKRTGKRGEAPTFFISCGIRLNFVEEILNKYVIEEMKIPGEDPTF